MQNNERSVLNKVQTGGAVTTSTNYASRIPPGRLHNAELESSRNLPGCDYWGEKENKDPQPSKTHFTSPESKTKRDRCEKSWQRCTKHLSALSTICQLSSARTLPRGHDVSKRLSRLGFSTYREPQDALPVTLYVVSFSRLNCFKGNVFVLVEELLRVNVR